jgi:DNA-binding transcriptional MerR regulator
MRPIDRNKYGHLLYDKSCVERARRIKYLQKLGFKLKDIVVLIDAPEEVFREAIEIKLEELKNKIECLEELEEETEKLLKSIQS